MNANAPLLRNKQNTQAFMQALGKGDVQKIMTMCVDGSQFWQVGYELALAGAHPMEKALQSLATLYRRCPEGVNFDIFSMIAEGNKVAFEAEAHGVFSDGQPYNNQHHSVLHFNEAGDVIEFRDYWDSLYAYEYLYDGEPGERTVVTDSDKRLQLKTILLLIKYLSPKHYLKRLFQSWGRRSLAIR